MQIWRRSSLTASMTITTKCFSPPGTSTPGPSKPGMNAVEYTPIVEEPGSEISIMSGNDLKKTDDSDISGVEELDMALSARHTIYSNSFMDPFDLTVYSSESVNNFDEENLTDDEYEPSFDVSLRLDHGISLGESDNEEEEDGDEEEDHQFCQESETELGYGIKRVRSNDEIGTLLQDHPALVFTSNLLELATTRVHYKCKVNGCTEDVRVTLDTVSSAVYLKWVYAITFCEKSTMTIKYVEKCPTDAKSWKIAAEKMNCESIEQDCSDSFNTGRHQFQYHCVINAWKNATLEVCALNRTILGYCTEYSINGTVIQDNYRADCTKFNPPCPSSYNSAEAYKYQTCYDLVKRNRKMLEYTVEDSKHPNSASERLCDKLALPILAIIHVIRGRVL